MRNGKVTLIDIVTLIIIALILALAVWSGTHSREAEEERKQSVPIINKMKGDFFSVGQNGNYLILEVQTERTNGEMEK